MGVGVCISRVGKSNAGDVACGVTAGSVVAVGNTVCWGGIAGGEAATVIIPNAIRILAIDAAIVVMSIISFQNSLSQ